jgi:hypothetical protein
LHTVSLAAIATFASRFITLRTTALVVGPGEFSLCIAAAILVES